MGGQGSHERALPETRQGRPERRRSLAVGLIGVLGATILSLIIITSFVSALHDPGPRSVPLGIVGPPAAASQVRSSLDHQVPGGFTVTSYSTQAAARGAIANRTIDAALVTGPHAQHLLVAQAVSSALTNTITKIFTASFARAGIPLTVTDIRPLHSSDPQGLSQVFFVVGLMTASFTFGNLLVRRLVPELHPLSQLALILVYAPVVAAGAVAIADAAIGALTGAPWGLFGIGALLAFAVAVMAAAAARWGGGIGVAVIGLLFLAVGIPSTGTTLGPNMITPWYADVGKALPPGNALPAVLNTTYFNGNDITTKLLILSAWALAGTIAMVMAAILHPPIPGAKKEPAHTGEVTADRPTSARPQAAA